MNFNIAPPQSKEVEKDVLSVMCNRPELIVKVEEILHSECFYDPDYRFLFDIVFGIHLAGGEVSQSSILNKVVPSGKKDILATYQEMKKYFTSDTALWRNAMLLSELAVKRSMLTKSMQLLGAVEANEPIEKLDTLVNEASDIMTTRNRPIEGITFAHSLDELNRLIDRPETKLSGIDTGVKDLNDVTGGWQVDDSIVIAGRPGMGKSLCGCFHAYTAAKLGIPVAFVSLEMAKVKLTARIVSNVAHVSSSDMTKGRLAMNQKTIVRDTMRKIEQLPIYYYENRNSWDINDICLTLRNWKRKYGIQLIFIDYIQLIKDRTVRDSSDKTKVVTSVQEKLTHLKSSIGTPIIELAQLSRANESRGDKRPGLSDLKNSGQIEQDATVVIFLYRQDYYDATAAQERGEEFTPTNDLEYIFAKNRDGEMGTVLVKASMSQNRIWSLNDGSPP
ncbi:replicative DNA helicase [Dyadobacter sp. BE34]|uniref:DNA 5'-3' helicase n=1 Tax=Dyadobacter fermentans TaxID=94254 RepID=A0ABU1QWK0_9BACT|nr:MULTISPECIES: DnaB-like helicase C-terminal domain-containing protein [Dyadobacter]MDR6805552.1 replicative DNA helicase [Dyadobacter fermentans]MDR7042688.1 replicative DNA helicase [Dyadobacter sp. BE242]MDR7197000.1 replicative DNA helicase [Dyadobacter sp. BE34]MDR7215565.1 replicative DNA helicase [Dyadobacter sp. BE31]MDR7263101.1 replicative DNA helicase [Dyadobacter sp. BE32]